MKGVSIEINKTYKVIYISSCSLIIESSGGSGLVILPKDLINEWANHLNKGSFTINNTPREMREIVKTTSTWSSHLNNFETHLKQVLVAYTKGIITDEMLKVSYDEEISVLPTGRPRTKSKFPTPQLILQGPPGTGKSHYLKHKLQEYGLTDESPKVERVVGHPELTSADFIGSYRPSTDSGTLQYGFVMGPFTRLLKKALANVQNESEPNQAHVLIIEELNRCNAAAMFAEVFQLLDRDDEGCSEYATSLGQDVNKALGLDAEAKVKLPPNLAIWATINTADQGVFPMDTAFKRRWSFKYLGVNTGEEEWKKPEWNPEVPKCGSLTWQSLRLGLNAALASVGIDEDRHLGGFFLSKRELKTDRVTESISTKVIGYLRDDVLRYEPQLLFKSEKDHVPGFSRLLTQMEADGVLSVFNSSVLKIKAKQKAPKQDATEQTEGMGKEEANQVGGAQE